MKVFHRTEIRKKGGMVILISDKTDFKKKTIQTSRRPLYDKGLIHQKVYIHTLLHMQTYKTTLDHPSILSKQ